MISTIPFCHTQKDISKSEATENNRRLGKAVSEMNETIWFIYQDKKSNYWFSSKEKGVFSYDGKELIHYTKEDGLVSNQIREIQEDSIGNLFFETSGSRCRGRSDLKVGSLGAETRLVSWGSLGAKPP